MRLTDKERLADYERSAAEPWRWHSAADKAFEAAANLRCIHEKAMSEIRGRPTGVVGAVPEGFYMDQCAHYFEGKCIELYLKCLLIQSGTKVTQDGKMTREMKSHDLREFCRKAGLRVTESENETLRKLTEAVTYWGTYPIPTRVESWRPKVAGIEGVGVLWSWTPGDTKNYIQLVSRLRERIGPA